MALPTTRVAMKARESLKRKRAVPEGYRIDLITISLNCSESRRHRCRLHDHVVR